MNSSSFRAERHQFKLERCNGSRHPAQSMSTESLKLQSSAGMFFLLKYFPCEIPYSFFDSCGRDSSRGFQRARLFARHGGSFFFEIFKPL